MQTNDTKLTQLVEELRAALGTNLRTVLLYGSAARGDHTGRGSDLNVMAVIEDGAPRGLEPAARTQRRWRKGGNPPILFVTEEWIRNSTDVFPLEFTDMLDARKVLHGADPLEGVTVSQGHLRHQCEHQLRSLVLKLRAAYLDAHGKASDLQELITASIGSVAAVARGALRLTGGPVPLGATEVLDAVSERFHLDRRALLAAAELRGGRPSRSLDEVKAVFLGYFDQIAALGRALDRLEGTPGGAGEEER
ncbi:MAG TPA: nucleotidyltransferase domain-containing protein [Candidatus Saccharimonadales bacterium]|nr:nucleotidyltransferase domain-containing protein [Candidatus Saccharimonadales bacterium]